MQAENRRAPFAEGTAAYKNNQVTADFTIISQIYNHLINLLTSPRIRKCTRNMVLPIAPHPLTKEALISDGHTIEQIKKLEADCVESMCNYEVVRDVPLALYNDLKSEGKLDLIFDGVCAPVPGALLNALICEAMQRRFPRELLLSTPGFIEVCTNDESGVCNKSIRLDIDDRHARRGFIMPDFYGKLITALKVFRYPNDPRPFILTSRRFREGGENNA